MRMRDQINLFQVCFNAQTKTITVICYMGKTSHFKTYGLKRTIMYSFAYDPARSTGQRMFPDEASFCFHPLLSADLDFAFYFFVYIL